MNYKEVNVIENLKDVRLWTGKNLGMLLHQQLKLKYVQLVYKRLILHKD